MELLLRNAFRNASAIPTTPSAPVRWLRIFVLMAQPPLLYKEGNCQPDIRSHLHRPRPQGGRGENYEHSALLFSSPGTIPLQSRGSLHSNVRRLHILCKSHVMKLHGGRTCIPRRAPSVCERAEPDRLRVSRGGLRCDCRQSG